MPTPPRIHLVVAILLLLAFGLFSVQQDTAGNQQGPGINDRLGNLNGLCRLNGGVPGAYSTDTVVTRFHCKGGYLDGLYCDVYADLTYCYWERVGTTGSKWSTGPGEVTTNVQDLTFVTDLSSDAVAPLTIDTPAQPVLVQAVIVWNPPADTVSQARMIQVNACRHLGGTERVAEDQRAGMYTVACDGGMLHGLWCSLAMGMTACFFEPEPAPVASATEPPPVDTQPVSSTPADTPATGAPATTAPTTEPTVPSVPTEPADPNDEPVIEPTFTDPATDNPWSLPEGTLQPFEPAPPATEAPILT